MSGKIKIQIVIYEVTKNAQLFICAFIATVG